MSDGSLTEGNPRFDAAHTQSVLAYFAAKADSYNLVDTQVYWRLSDELLWAATSEFALSVLSPDLRFLDAGGGTGRWTDRILRAVPGSSGILFDLSADMTRLAAARAERSGNKSRLRIMNGDLADVARVLGNERFDLVLSFHNVLGFVRDVDAVVSQLTALLAPNGRMVLFLPNRYHVAFFNLLQCRIEEAEVAISRNIGRFTPEMPYIHLFTPDSLRALLTGQGLAVEILGGFPSLIYPGYQETQSEGSSRHIADLLQTDDGYQRVLSLEESLLREPSVAARGNNLFAVARKD